MGRTGDRHRHPAAIGARVNVHRIPPRVRDDGQRPFFRMLHAQSRSIGSAFVARLRCLFLALDAGVSLKDRQAPDPAREQMSARKIISLMSKQLTNALLGLAATAVMACAVIACGVSAFGATDPLIAKNNLRPAADFQHIQDAKGRSRAIFGEIGRLLTHPRCMNCHPASEHPLQGADRHEHMPPVWRGEGGHFATNCSGCHTERNVTLHEAASYQSIPGHPRWGVAPSSMAWEGKSLGEICRQLKDTDRNGGRDLAMLQEHVAKDDLVAWAWSPGEGREPAPGSQDAAGKLFQAWIESGAECPQ